MRIDEAGVHSYLGLPPLLVVLRSRDGRSEAADGESDTRLGDRILDDNEAITQLVRVLQLFHLLRNGTLSSFQLQNHRKRRRPLNAA